MPKGELKGVLDAPKGTLGGGPTLPLDAQGGTKGGLDAPKGTLGGGPTLPLDAQGGTKGGLDAPVILAQARIYRVYEISQPL